ncbi:hypothetical protein CCP2SC5_60022 [Azospirillaceae bacterium]
MGRTAGIGVDQRMMEKIALVLGKACSYESRGSSLLCFHLVERSGFFFL